MKEKRFCFVNDESGNNYCIPLEDIEEFEKWALEGPDSEEIEQKFRKMELPLSINSYSFTDLKEI